MGRNAVAMPLSEIPEVSTAELRDACLARCARGSRLVALFAVPRGGDRLELFAVLADDAEGTLVTLRAPVAKGEGYPALTAALPQAQAFERAIFEDHAVVPEGHPWLKPLRRHDGPEYAFFRVEGAGVHEVAVGPVHAGVIEPGHFRFQCRGEEVLHLEIRLGYQHRGVRRLMLGSPPARRLVVAESVAGDTAVGHALAYCAAMEALGGAEPPLYAGAVRAIALELERVASHVGDLGALCNDVGYLPGASWLGRLRGDFLNLLLDLSGNRFGRGAIVPGGVRFGLESERPARFVARLEAAERDVEAVAARAFDAGSVAARFEQTGVVSRETAEQLGLVGVVARASGLDRDARRDHPLGAYRYALVPVAVAATGDVMARALVRRHEVRRSLTFLREQMGEIGEPALRVPVPAPRPDMLVVTLVEGWRGEIAHVAVTGTDGALVAYEVIDPSFRNWLGLAMALRGEQISDFPLCNKSFNLSYAGHDL